MDQKRIFVTPRLSSLPYDEVWHKTLDDALDYIGENLTEWISCRISEQEIIALGVSFDPLIKSRLVGADEYDAVFNHGEMVSE